MKSENVIEYLQVLVGESIVKQSDPTKGIAGLFGKDISVWGIAGPFGKVISVQPRIPFFLYA